MNVFKHLFSTYRTVYLWFWAVMALFVLAIVLSFVVFGPYIENVMDASVWQGAAGAAPRWFVFVIGIMLATVNLTVVIASGITRRAYFAAVFAFTLATAALFEVASLAGFGVERAGFATQGLTGFLPVDYPLNSWNAAASYTGEAFLALWGFMLSGWAIGLLFYRLRVWYAILLIPVGLGPIIGGGSLPPLIGQGARIVTLTVGLALATALGFLLVRSAPVRPKKA
ncbi:hypothetical protein Rhe02_68650 [Rhizocola hellebori]|uniref:Uncharacterized protein n=1 Tax=Rhizocola hellebori TaxID=1392758 RepID=A0A8J3QFY9_9ACTN|nr:hypothetical protein [Rhizocola hellebori]GIH08798.1 hypothetical protein Rhe02_68650 [Rhizocola hellebori]